MSKQVSNTTYYCEWDHPSPMSGHQRGNFESDEQALSFWKERYGDKLMCIYKDAEKLGKFTFIYERAEQQ